MCTWMDEWVGGWEGTATLIDYPRGDFKYRLKSAQTSFVQFAETVSVTCSS